MSQLLRLMYAHSKHVDVTDQPVIDRKEKSNQVFITIRTY